LLALCSDSIVSVKACVFYMIFYVIMTFAIFSIVLVSTDSTKFLKYLINWSYFSKRNLVLTIGFSVVLFSLAGIPPLTGFYSKLLIFLALLQEDRFYTMVIMALLSCVGCFYYIRLIKIFFFCSNRKGHWVHSSDRFLELCLIVACFFVFFFLARPESILQASNLLSFSFSGTL
jgi:NADH-quinone oxidoreductase subunit N